MIFFFWITLIAAAKSPRSLVAGLYRAADGGVSLAVKVAAQPENGRASWAAIETLALGLPKSSMAISSGGTDRMKAIRIAGNPAEIQARLASLLTDSKTG